MAADDTHDPKGGNSGGSRAHRSIGEDVRKPDEGSQSAPNANEGADPSDDIRDQNPGETTTANLADGVEPHDPHKVEKLTKAGRPNIDPDEGTD